MAPWTAIGATAAVATLAVFGTGERVAASGQTSVREAQARSVATEFFRSQNQRQYDRTCAVLSHGFYAKHRLPDRQTCIALLRISFMWSGPIAFEIGGVERVGDSCVVQATADGAPGRIVLVREKGGLKILTVGGA